MAGPLYNAFKISIAVFAVYQLGHPANQLFLSCEKYFPDQSIQETVYFHLKSEALFKIESNKHMAVPLYSSEIHPSNGFKKRMLLQIPTNNLF